MDMRDMRGMDGRNPYGSEGGYVVSSRGRGRGRRRGGRRGDRGMDYADGRMSYPMRDFGDYESDMARGGRGSRGGQGGRSRGGDRGDMGYDMRSDYGYDMARQGDMRSDYARQGGMDGHYPQGQMGGYQPIEFMGYCNGYYGMPQQDYARGRGRDYGYDMRGGDYARGGRRDYGDYADDYGDYGETLSNKELEHWCKKLKEKLNDQEKQMFSKEMIAQMAKQMGREMKEFGIEELEVVTLMLLDDYKKTLGANPDLMIKLAFDWLDDKDASVKGAEKLAVYYDEIVMGGEE